MARILIIDDDGPVRYTIRRVLESDGHEVDEAVDGQLGLEAYGSHPPDLVIVDILMPVKNGLEVVEELRQDYPDAKIVATAGIGRWILFDAEVLGADRSFLKPFDIDDLRSIVTELLEDTHEDPVPPLPDGHQVPNSEADSSYPGNEREYDRPEGMDLKPHQVLAMVGGDKDYSEHEGRPVVFFRHRDGEAYALGLEEDFLLWWTCGYLFIGTVAFIRGQMKLAEEQGVKERSIVWYLLRDVEREIQAAD